MANNNKEISKQYKNLNRRVKKLNKLLEKRTSYLNNFFMGILTGVGSFIGAALIGSLIVGVLVANIDKLGDIPLIRSILPPEKVEEYIQDTG